MNILIIDDEPKIRNGLINLLSTHENWTVSGAFSDAASALKFMYESENDVIITDIQMPGMSGLDMISRIRERNTDVPVVILSGYGNFLYAQRAIELGVRKYLTKPTNTRELVATLEQIESELLKEAESLQSVSDAAISNLLVLRAVQHMEIHYSEKIGLKDVANELYISPNYLSELFRKHTGQTFSDYLLTLRMEKSKSYLRSIAYKVSDIAGLVGFSDSRYFSSTFKKFFGMTPMEFRGKYAEETGLSRLERKNES
ncbi:MAG: DNA-binding response regulator [Firmicutes bacterium HGW-Firmicutes-16]|nr:MAG: DNA-binding response regulator [Firmicutes bacterium HGW-Firmicutes-16]